MDKKEKDDEYAWLYVLAFVIFSPIMLPYLIFGAVFCSIAKFLGLPEEWGIYLAMAMTAFLFYDVLSGHIHFTEADYIGLDGMSHSE